MARAWRIEFKGALYQAVSRGNDCRDIFFNDDDRRLFLGTLGEMAQRFEIELFAFVRMNNHYHLLLITRQANLSRAMQRFGVTYTNGFNAGNSHSGHLFQGRFKSMLAQNDSYLMRLSLYIHRNPLRAGYSDSCPSRAVVVSPYAAYFFVPPSQLSGHARRC